MNCHMLCKLSWLLSAIAAIHVGLIPFGFDMFRMIPMSMAFLIVPLHYLFGLAGVISLIGYIRYLTGMSCGHSHGGCD